MLVQRLKSEARQVGFVMLYFFFAFMVINTLKMLYLAEHAIDFPGVAKAVVGALLVGKVVVVLDKTSFGDRFRRHAVVFDVLYRTLLYTGAIMIVLGLERVFHGYREAGNLAGAWAYALETADLMRFFGNLLGVFMAFVGYNLLAALSEYIGRDRLLRFVFTRDGRRTQALPQDAEAVSPTAPEPPPGPQPDPQPGKAPPDPVGSDRDVA